MDSLRRLEEIFARFPGIGPRQARRFVYYLMNKSPASIREFTQLVEEVKKNSSECEQCHRFFLNDATRDKVREPICAICADKSRDSSTLMIVARDSDFESVERSGVYKGDYFILGGTVPIMDKKPEKRIRLEKLLLRVSDMTSRPDFTEIILSLNTTPDGEHTSQIVTDALKKLLANAGKSVRITVMGRGLSTGAELEYVDGDTIRNALQNRH